MRNLNFKRFSQLASVFLGSMIGNIGVAYYVSWTATEMQDAPPLQQGVIILSSLVLFLLILLATFYLYSPDSLRKFR